MAVRMIRFFKSSGALGSSHNTRRLEPRDNISPSMTSSQVRELLPHRWKAAQTTRTKTR